MTVLELIVKLLEFDGRTEVRCESAPDEYSSQPIRAVKTERRYANPGNPALRVENVVVSSQRLEEWERP